MLSHVNPILTLVLAVYLVVQPTTQAAAGPIHANWIPVRVAPRADPTPTCVPGGSPGAPGAPGVAGANGTAGVNGVPGTPGIRACDALSTAAPSTAAPSTAAPSTATEAADTSLSATATGPTPRTSSSTIPSSDGPSPVNGSGFGSSVLALLAVVAQVVL